MKIMLLQKISKNLPKEKKKLKIYGISNNSKKIKRGYVFFAIKGKNFNGEKYIDEAIKKGAVAVVCAKNCKYKQKDIPIIKTSNTRLFLSKVCSDFYKLKPKNIIAVTGTNGKTSVADLFYQILGLNNVPVASIGTLGIKYKKKIIKSNLTSPDTIFLHEALQKIKKNNINNVIIEASSHGLYQHRIDHLDIKAGIFTNFSQDHLDYHKTMQSYLKAKMILFNNLLAKRKTIISDSSIKEFNNLKKISKRKKLHIIDIITLQDKLHKDEKINFFNEFQLKNLSMAISAAKLCNLSVKKIFNTLNKLKDVNGRLEHVRTFPNNIRVFVDFAHTPDALSKTLSALKSRYGNNISLVFGCGGDRDFKKRSLMGKIADKNCKKIYITDDNPRNERPEKIRQEVFKHIKNINCFNIANRAKAIRDSIKNANPNEIILIAGKGHEEEQIYKNKIIKVSDRKIVKNLKIKIKTLTKKDQKFLQNDKILKNITNVKRFKNFHGIAIDSRVTKKNNLFLAIKGKNNDGISFIPKALKKGAKYIIANKKIKKFKKKIIKVNNVINFLNEFAKKKREDSSAKIIAITGSAGKTSLKNLIKDLLQNFGDTLHSPKSYNNQYGVPISLSFLTPNHNYGVFEVGMSKAGEINSLTKLIKPHIGIITNIGEAHIENFKNVKGIAKAKGEIINNIRKNGTIILNQDDKYFHYLKSKAKLRNLNIVSFGLSKMADIHPISIKKNSHKTKILIKIKNQNFDLEIKNINIYNVLSSLALLKVLNLNIEKVIKKFSTYNPIDGRGKIHKIKRYNKKFKLIDESYNANPLSVKNAINNFNNIKKQNFKKYLVLGDMLELGKKSIFFHKDISKVINNSDIDKVFIKGNETLNTYKSLNVNKRGNIFQQDEDVDFTLNNIISNNDYLMIKGSNATGLNNFTKKIIKGN